MIKSMELFEKPSYLVIHSTKCEVLSVGKVLILNNVFYSIRLVLGEAVGKVNPLAMS